MSLGNHFVFGVYSETHTSFVTKILADNRIVIINGRGDTKIEKAAAKALKMGSPLVSPSQIEQSPLKPKRLASAVLSEMDANPKKYQTFKIETSPPIVDQAHPEKARHLKPRQGVTWTEDNVAMWGAFERWQSKTNVETLVKLSSGEAYPANKVWLGEQDQGARHGVAYILSEAPRSNAVFESQRAFYQMAVEQGVQLLVSVMSVFRGSQVVDPDVPFLQRGESLSYGDTKITCEEEKAENFPWGETEFDAKGRTENPNAKFFARKLRVEERGKPDRIMWQLVTNQVYSAQFLSHVALVDFVNTFAEDNDLIVDKDHPLLVNCMTGIDRSGRFLLVHDLLGEIDAFITEHPQDDPVKLVEMLTKHIDVRDLFLARAALIAVQSTKSAAIIGTRESLLPKFSDDLEKIYCLEVDQQGYEERKKRTGPNKLTEEQLAKWKEEQHQKHPYEFPGLTEANREQFKKQLMLDEFKKFLLSRIGKIRAK